MKPDDQQALDALAQVYDRAPFKLSGMTPCTSCTRSFWTVRELEAHKPLCLAELEHKVLGPLRRVEAARLPAAR